MLILEALKTVLQQVTWKPKLFWFVWDQHQ